MPRGRGIEDLTGRRFGRLLVLRYFGSHCNQHAWVCKCDCGVEKVIARQRFFNRRDPTKSCGCIQREWASTRRLHGMHNSKIYKVWTAMKQRCHNEECEGYENYGGRGIKVCERWRNSFVYFFEDMGYPEGTRKYEISIDRIDNNGNYEPGNCRWTTMGPQSNNKRSNINITFNGKTQTLKEWTIELGLKYITCLFRWHKNPDPNYVFSKEKYQGRKIY